MRKQSLKDAEAAIEETVKKWDPAKDPHIEVCTAVSLVCTAVSLRVYCAHLHPLSRLHDALNAVACVFRLPCCNTWMLH